MFRLKQIFWLVRFTKTRYPGMKIINGYFDRIYAGVEVFHLI